MLLMQCNPGDAAMNFFVNGHYFTREISDCQKLNNNNFLFSFKPLLFRHFEYFEITPDELELLSNPKNFKSIVRDEDY